MLPITRGFRTHAPLLAILASAVALRFYHVDFQSVWVDEINTMVQARPDQSLVDTYRALLSYDLQPPLYFYILKYLFRLFGYTTLVMRFFSAALGVAGVWALYLLGSELVSRRAGLVSALFLCFNYYHIHYSQEGRPYAFLILFCSLSFVYLSRFLQRPDRRTALLYGLFSALMLYGHPIALFALLSQCLVLLYYFVTVRQKRKDYLKKGLLSAVVLLLLYLPALPLLYSASSVTAFWIEPPGPGIFTFILSQFFGGSELVLAIVYLLLLFFFIFLFSAKPPANNCVETRSLPRTGIILAAWLVCCILLPLIRSYTNVPMIIPRYMNVVLPAVIVMMGIAIETIPGKAVRYSILLAFCCFSITDLAIVKDYYNRRTKTDFRGITNYVVEHMQPQDQIVSRIGWHYGYMFENTQPKYPVLWNSFQAYVETAIKWPQNFNHDFWFVDAQNEPLSLTSGASEYLNQHYFVDRRKDLYQALGIHHAYKDSTYIRLNFALQPQISGNNGGSAELTENTPLVSDSIELIPGKYDLLVAGGSANGQTPNGISAHLSICQNGQTLGGFFLSRDETITLNSLTLSIKKRGRYQFSFTFDNGFTMGGEKRTASLTSIHIHTTNQPHKD